MQVFEKLYEGMGPLYPIEQFCDRNSALFIDIETTGLKKETTSLYLIGCGYYTPEGFMTRLLFADTPDEEKELLIRFYEDLSSFTHLFHFNGTGFDIPYLQYKAAIYDLGDLFEGITQVDIYKLVKPLRYLLFADTMRQKAIESFLDVDRVDTFGGGELIEVYRDYTISKNEDDLQKLVTHNLEDVVGMHRIMPILYYLSFRDAPLSFEGYRTNTYTDLYGDEHEEIILSYSTELTFPRSFCAKTESMYVKASAENKKILIRLPIYTEDMKIFFDNYRDYFYIPDEDTVILRSIGQSLPKGSYVKATKETCYRKVSGKFVKQPSDIFTPVVRTSYKDKKKYFLFPDCFKKEAADEFGRELINVFFTMKRR